MIWGLRKDWDHRETKMHWGAGQFKHFREVGRGLAGIAFAVRIEGPRVGAKWARPRNTFELVR